MAVETHPNIKEMIGRYNLAHDDAFEALREILQEVVLLGLAEAGFFDEAVFYGGTALRILYDLPRFSEDLDFSLLKPDQNFDLKKYEKAVIDKLAEYGFEVSIETKTDKGEIQSAFLKGNTVKHLLAINAPEKVVGQFHADKLVRIKFEVDTEPPLNFRTEEKFHLRPIPFKIKTMVPACLFAGKMHAVLCRGWQDRPKGRDWYDLVWYVKKEIPLDITHLASRLAQSCKALKSEEIEIPEIEKVDEEFINEALTKRIQGLDITAAKNDVIRFISDEKELDIWSEDFFMAIVSKIKYA